MIGLLLGCVSLFFPSAVDVKISTACPVDMRRLSALLALEDLDGFRVDMTCRADRATVVVKGRTHEQARQFSFDGRREPELSRYIALLIGETRARLLAPRRKPASVKVAKDPSASREFDRSYTVALGYRAVFVQGARLQGLGLDAAYGFDPGPWGFDVRLVWARGQTATSLGDVDANLGLAMLGPHARWNTTWGWLRYTIGVELGLLAGRGRPAGTNTARSVVAPVFGPTSSLDVRFAVWQDLGVGITGTVGYATRAAVLQSGTRTAVAVDGLHGWLGLSLDWNGRF